MKKNIIYLIFIIIFCSMPIAGYCQEYVTDTIPVMTLKAYEDSVVNYSQVLKQKKEQFFAAKAKKDVSRTGYLPKISAAGSGTIDLKRLNQWHNPRGIYHPYTYFAGGNVSQVIYGGGSVIAQYKADEISEDISQQQVLLNVNDIFLQADNAYWTAAANQELLHVSREYYNIILNQYHIIKLKFDNGAIAKNDLLMITTRLKEAELDIKKAEASYLLAFQNFNILMGITPDHRPEKIESILSELDFPLEGTYETALSRRHDYKIAEMQISLARQNKRVARAQYNPQLNFQFQGGWGTASPINYGYPPSGIMIGSLSLSWTIWQWGARANTLRQMNSLINGYKYNLQNVADQINKDVSNALTTVLQSLEQINVAQQNLDLAQESLNLNTFSYNQGKISIADVLSSQLSWIQAYSNLIQANYSYKTAVAQYERAIGDKTVNYDF